jgi:hypothetical protein
MVFRLTRPWLAPENPSKRLLRDPTKHRSAQKTLLDICSKET